MTTTLKTPTDQQWQWLCEKAGWEVVETDFGHLVYPTEGSSLRASDLHHNTDALMRLMDAVFDDGFSVCVESSTVSFEVSMSSPMRYFDSGPSGIDSDVCIRIQECACDILAQLAEAEGVE